MRSFNDTTHIQIPEGRDDKDIKLSGLLKKFDGKTITREDYHCIAAGLLVLSLLACSASQTAIQPPMTAINVPPSQTPAVNSDLNTPPAEAPATAGLAEPTLTTSDDCNNRYFPVVAGASWGYKLSGPIPDSFTHVILSVESNGFLEQDEFGSGSTRQGRWQCANGNLIALNPTAADASNFRAEGVSADFETRELSGITIPVAINIGDAWAQSLTLEGTQTIDGISHPARSQLTTTCRAIGRESVTVDAGTFNALRVECQTDVKRSTAIDADNLITNALSLTGTSWYVEDIGLVKSITSSPGFDSIIELVYYNIPQFR